MSEVAALTKRLREQIVSDHIERLLEEAASRIVELEAFAAWVDTWVSNPVSSYSVSALDGLFGMTRDKLAALQDKGEP